MHEDTCRTRNMRQSRLSNLRPTLEVGHTPALSHGDRQAATARFVGTLALILLLAPRASDAGESRTMQATPPPPGLPTTETPGGLPTEIADRIRAATSVHVYRVKGQALMPCTPEAGTSDDAILCHSIDVVESPPSKTWSRAIGDVIAGGVHASEGRVAERYHPDFAIRFQSGDHVTDVLLSTKQEHFYFASTGYAPIQGYPRAPRLKYLRLLAEAWPRDGALQGMIRAEEQRLEDHESRARAGAATASLHPLWPDCQPRGEGEFVYYEEEPVPLEAPQPEFPRGAVATHGGGKVILHVFVDTRGRVCYAKAIHGEAPFIPHAVDAVRRWVFRPAMANGKPVGVWVEIPFQVR